MRWIIFDGWGVVYDTCDDIRDLLLPFLAAHGVHLDYDTVDAIYCEAYVGGITAHDFWTRVGVGEKYPQIQSEYLDTRPTVDPEFVPVAESLAGAYHLGFLSNDLDEWSDHLRRRFDLDRLFEVTVISDEARVAKPEAGIYQIALERSGASPSDCVFIDDRPANLAAAAAVGLGTIWFDRDEPPVGEFPPDATIRSFGELPAVLTGLWPAGAE